MLALLLLRLLVAFLVLPALLAAAARTTPSPLVARLLKDLSLKQKVGQMTQLSASMLIGKDNRLDSAKARQIFSEYGVGSQTLGMGVSIRRHLHRALRPGVRSSASISVGYSRAAARPMRPHRRSPCYGDSIRHTVPATSTMRRCSRTALVPWRPSVPNTSSDRPPSPC
jgi:hypothetical protein